MTPAVRSVDLHTGVTIEYAVEGDVSGVPLVLVHGLADSWRVFDPLLPHLPASVRTFAPSQRGHGDSGRPSGGYRPEDFAKDLEAFIDALELEAPVIAGASSGGLTARRFAIDHPDRTLGLVLLGSPFSLREKPGVQEMWDSTFAKLRDPIEPAMVRDFGEQTIGFAVPRDLFEVLIQENQKVPAQVWTETMKGLLEDHSSEELDAIKAPTLIVWGEDDQILPRSDQEALAAAITDSRLIVHPGGGHMFYVEAPARTAFDLAAFIEDIVRSR